MIWLFRSCPRALFFTAYYTMYAVPLPLGPPHRKICSRTTIAWCFYGRERRRKNVVLQFFGCSKFVRLTTQELCWSVSEWKAVCRRRAGEESLIEATHSPISSFLLDDGDISRLLSGARTSKDVGSLISNLVSMKPCTLQTLVKQRTEWNRGMC